MIVDDHGAFVTTDPMDLDRFEELGVALAGALREVVDAATVGAPEQ